MRIPYVGKGCPATCRGARTGHVTFNPEAKPVVMSGACAFWIVNPPVRRRTAVGGPIEWPRQLSDMFIARLDATCHPCGECVVLAVIGPRPFGVATARPTMPHGVSARPGTAVQRKVTLRPTNCGA
jgi:hypothetical protein